MLLRVGRVITGVLALLLAAPAAFPLHSLGPRLAADGCPASAAGAWEGGDRPGDLVPADGAVSVTMCEIPLPYRAPPPQGPVRVRKLTTQVDAMVAELNALPTRDVLEAGLRRSEAAKGRVLGDDLHLGEICTAVGFGTSLSYVVHYAGRRPPAVVLVDRNCGTARYAGRTRFGNPVNAFLGFYLTQLQARPKPVVPPGCAAGLPAAKVDLHRPQGWPRDDVAVNRGPAFGELLPSPLSAAIACRYRADDGVLRLRAQVAVPAGLASVRSLINASTVVRPGTDSPATPPGPGRTGCGMDGIRLPADLDVVWVGDITGAVVEVRVWRAPCRAVHAGRTAGRVPTAELLSRLDAWLGPGP
ncbi:hypothetical protein GCM10009850_035610 [Nonomuraea monospora]|uniref:Secreted protein n=1 Tax=Nonomuraea monospora TaxID=568818 RepID=A0ABN3CFC9_9ACTN